MLFEKFTKMRLRDPNQKQPCWAYRSFSANSDPTDDHEREFIARTNGSKLYSSPDTYYSILAEYRYLAPSTAVGMSTYSAQFNNTKIGHFHENYFERDEIAWQDRLKQEEKVQIGDLVVMSKHYSVSFIKKRSALYVLDEILKYYLVIDKDETKATCLTRLSDVADEFIIYIPWTLYVDESYYQ